MRVSNLSRRGGIDLIDLLVGILLAVCLPFFSYFVLRLVEGQGPDSQPSVEAEPLKEPPPDREEVDTRMEYIRKLYYENAVVFAGRAKSENPLQQLSELKWANASLHQVKAELTALEDLIRRTGASSTFHTKLEEIATLKHSVDEALRDTAEQDILGILRNRQ